MAKTNSPIPMVRAAFARQFSETMRENGIDSMLYYRRVRLPARIPEDPNALLPEKPFWSLVNLIAREEGLEDFGYQVARGFPWHGIETLRPLISQSDSVRSLLERFCVAASSQSSQVNFRLKDDSGHTWFIADGKPLLRNDRQMEFYRLTCMIQLVQLGVGSGWRPDRIRMFMPSAPIASCCPITGESEIEFWASQTAIRIPNPVMDFPVAMEIFDVRLGPEAIEMEGNFLTNIKQIMELYILHKQCDVDTIAEVINMAPRTLQRRLSELGTSFNRILAEIKLDLASRRLTHNTTPIHDIALELGYNDTPHFSRAFRKWTGMTPRQYRLQNGCG